MLGDKIKCLLLAVMAAVPGTGLAQVADIPDIDRQVQALAPKVVAWRRDIHAHPELGFQETRTAALVAAHLQRLGFDEVRTGVGQTGVLGVLKGGKPGSIVALRADMDALPIREATGLPFASKLSVDVNGVDTPVMHACGHDAHTAILMGAAELLAGMRERIPGTVLFVFQPAEEGAPGQPSGAPQMLRDGVFEPYRPEAVFGLHVEPGPVGRIDARPGGFLSSSTALRIRLQGRQTHGARPWEGTDLINLSADIVKALTTISARRVNVFASPNVITIGSLQAGNRGNILPGQATLEGTIRTFDMAQAEQIKALIRTSVAGLAQAYEASAEVTFEDGALVTGNDPALLAMVMPALQAAAGAAGVDTDAPRRAAAEDFSFFQQDIPGVYYILGSTPGFTSMAAAPTNHSDRFDIDEAVLPIGVKAQVLTALQFLHGKAADPR